MPTRTDRRAWDSAERALTGLALAVSAGLLAVWLPNYLRWPLFWDAEHFAQTAREWDAGVSLPYRDGTAYNWPGQIYLYWVGGKLLGWGRTAAVPLMDVLLLGSFGLGVLAWSRRCLGGRLPGALAWLGLVVFYLNCSFLLAGQRTWQAGLFAAAALMTA